jgi:hypothetical protein
MDDVQADQVDDVGEVSAPDLARVNVSLIPDGASALAALVERTGLKKVDVVNRSLQLFAMVDAELRAGNALIFRAPDGTEERVRIL